MLLHAMDTSEKGKRNNTSVNIFIFKRRYVMMYADWCRDSNRDPRAGVQPHTTRSKNAARYACTKLHVFIRTRTVASPRLLMLV
jgi:hypothetical protein